MATATKLLPVNTALPAILNQLARVHHDDQGEKEINIDQNVESSS